MFYCMWVGALCQITTKMQKCKDGLYFFALQVEDISGYVKDSFRQFYEKSDTILQQPHKCFIMAVEGITNSLWLKYGNRVPLLKAPPYKDHSKEEKNKSDEE